MLTTWLQPQTGKLPTCQALGGGSEIRNHWTRDAILREDHTRSRNPTLVGAFALLRSALLAI